MISNLRYFPRKCRQFLRELRFVYFVVNSLIAIPEVIGGFVKVIRYSLLFTNVLIFMSGFGVFGFGIWALLVKDDLGGLVKLKLYDKSVAVLLSGGVFIIFVSFIGFIGAIDGIKPLLALYFVILIVVFIFVFASSILGYFYAQTVSKKLHTELVNTVVQYNTKKGITYGWDELQIQLQCCGTALTPNSYGWNIWSELNPREFDRNDTKVPASCCREKDEKAVENCQRSPQIHNAYLDDCFIKLKTMLKNKAKVIGTIGLTMFCLLILGMTLSCILYVMLDYFSYME